MVKIFPSILSIGNRYQLCFRGETHYGWGIGLDQVEIIGDLPPSIPVLSKEGMIVFILLIPALAFWTIRRKQLSA